MSKSSPIIPFPSPLFSHFLFCKVVVLEGERVFAPNRPKELLLLDYGGIGLVEQEYNGYTFNEAEHRWERKRELRR